MPFAVLEYIDGEVLQPTKDRPPTVARTIGTELMQTLARVHRVPVDKSRLGEVGGRHRVTTANALLSRWGRELDRLYQESFPVAPEYVRIWLRERMPPNRAAALIHGDYRLGNISWRNARVVGILDWEGAHIGDPMYDLAWCFMGTASDDDLVMATIQRRVALKIYEDEFGAPIDRSLLRWWEVMVGFIRIVMELKAIHLNQGIQIPDVRALTWEFGHGSSFRHMLQRMAEPVQ
jgi:aminoglycoside phosphotransferase (APT) family kinase protein